jgi:hypothetical protein
LDKVLFEKRLISASELSRFIKRQENILFLFWKRFYYLEAEFRLSAMQFMRCS